VETKEKAFSNEYLKQKDCW